MAESSLGVLIFVILLAVAFDFVNGFTDAPNAIATVVSTRALPPMAAVLMAGALNLVGALTGTAVAKTIGKDVVSADSITLMTVAAALVATIFWSMLAYRYGLPTSESHGLIAGITGAALATGGVKALLWVGWKKVFIGLVLSTLAGFFGAMVLAFVVVSIFSKTKPRTVSGLFRYLQVASAGLMAYSHGSNDAQKTMGIITLALMVHGSIATFQVPVWVMLMSAITMGVATAFGGWKIIKTMGINITKLEYYQGFCAETAAGAVIEASSRFGIPLSTTHTIGTAIMGVGASRRLRAVRWGVAGNVVAAWVLTFPVCMAIGAAFAFVANLIFR